MAPSSSAITLGWCGFAFNVIIANIIGHGLYTVYNKRSMIQWSARHFDQLYYALLWSMLFVAVELNLLIMEGILELFDLGLVLRWFLLNLFGMGFLGLWLLRAWLVHYDFHSGVAMFHLVSNPDLNEQQRESLRWFIDNKVNYGSPRYLTRFTVFMVIAVTLVMVGWSIVAPNSFVFGIVFVWLILLVVAITITRHIVFLDDNFFVQQELLIEFRILALGFIQAGIWVLFGPGMGWGWASFFLAECCAITIFGMCFVATYWVLRKTRQVGLDSERGPIGIEKPDNIPPLAATLKNEAATNAFISHLVNEISVENVFFLSDIMAFKKTFIKKGKLNEANGFMCPVGTKLARLTFRRTFTHYAWAISKTYIDGSSSLYVTCISDEVRDECTDALEDFDPDKERNEDGNKLSEIMRNTQVVFDSAAEEVYKELENAYTRWCYTNSIKDVDFSKVT